MLILDAQKNLRAEFLIADLQEQAGAAGDTPSIWITRGLEPGAHGIDPTEYFSLSVAAQAPAGGPGAEGAYQPFLSTLSAAMRDEPHSLALLLVEVSNLSDLHARLGFQAGRHTAAGTQ